MCRHQNVNWESWGPGYGEVAAKHLYSRGAAQAPWAVVVEELARYDEAVVLISTFYAVSCLLYCTVCGVVAYQALVAVMPEVCE